MAATLKGETPVKNPTVVMKTSLGSVTIELYPDKAPETVKNFLQYVNDKFYDGTIFHRVISNFMVQGGGMDAAMNKKPTRAPIANEAANGLKNERRHGRDGADLRAEQRDGPVLHQREGQRLPGLPRLLAAGHRATACSAR